MHTTPWTRNSTIPSDRIAPKSNQNVMKGKNKKQTPDQPKSKRVLSLEAQLAAVQASTFGKNKNPKGGCFCLARDHELSAYTPVCLKCALILCSLNQPSYSCPHCLSPLLNEPARQSLVTRLADQITECLEKEALAREKAIDDARKAAGAFPSLAPGTGSATQARQASQPAKILSLTSKKVTVRSAAPSPKASQPASRAESEDEGEAMVPPPSAEVVYSKGHVDPNRPWLNLRTGGVTYIPTDEPIKAPSRRNRKKAPTTTVTA